MKKIKNNLLIIVFMLLIGVTFNVKAEELSYYLSNSSQNYEYVDKNSSKAVNVKRGDKITVVATINYKNNINHYRLSNGKLTIRWDDKYLSLQEINGKYYNDSITDIAGLTIGSVSKGVNRFNLEGISSTSELKSGKNKIVEFSFLVLNDAPFGETKVYQMDGEDSLKCIVTGESNEINCGESLYSELKYNIAKSTVNKLSSIKINGQELEYFDEDKTDYDIEVESNVEKVNIDVVKKDSKSTISGNYGENKIQYGENKLVINVISESGSRNTYHINITRKDLRNNDNTLKTLTISSGEINFNPSINDYTVNVGNEIDKITITSSLNNSKAKYVTDFRNKEIELVEGSNKIEIKIISEKGEQKIYTININRALSSNNSLKSLKINDEKIELKENEFTYNFIVENEVEEVVIKAEANDDKATIDLKDNYPLEIGDNEITITVTAASGDKISYIININRNKLLSKDSLLTSLKIKGYNIDFKQHVTSYYLKIDDNVDELEITTTQEEPNATVEIEGNKDLINGSIIKINVKAEDGSFTRYFINIEKGSKGLSPIIIIILVLLGLLGLCIGAIIYLKKKKEKKEFDKLDDNSYEQQDVTDEPNYSNDDNEDSDEMPIEDGIVEHGRHEKIPNMDSEIQYEENNQQYSENDDFNEQNKDVEE